MKERKDCGKVDSMETDTLIKYGIKILFSWDVFFLSFPNYLQTMPSCIFTLEEKTSKWTLVRQ